MNINNGFNVLPWYDSLEKQNSKKWYAYGQAWPLLCPQGSILPFQFICDSAITITSTIYAVNAQTGTSVNLGVTPTVTKITRADATYYLVKLNSVAVTSLPIGRYNLRMNTSVGYLYSEEITIINNASECIKLEYWNEDTLRFTSGEINFDDNFHFILYINSTIGKPEYEFEEELTKRLGYKFIESQTSNKLYKFAFAAPEYICDALRLVRMCDYIKLTTKYDSYNALSFAYEPKWQEQGDLAAVDVEFDTDCIIQKLESFNRRVKESFYNALLADIDEPVLFSTDTVAQYYTEYTSVSSINGKLIRQLNAISSLELQDNLDSLVLALDNQADSKQEAKKVFLSDILGLVDSVSKLFKGHYDGAGNLLWIEALSHIGINGGLTMFIEDDKISLPSLYDGLPIDNHTLVWKDGVLMLNPNIELGGGLDEVELNQYLTNNNYAKKSDITTALNGYATTSALNAVSTKLNDFLEGSDTDTVINKWKELETFLSGLTESDNLATILTGKADKSYVDTNFVTIAGTEDVTGLHNFVNGLKVGGIELIQKNGNVFLKGSLVVEGGITMYGDGEGGSSIPSYSTLGSLLNVDESNDAVASVDRVMFQSAGSNVWSWKALSEIGGGSSGGGSVSGDYLPLSGGTISGDLTMNNSYGGLRFINTSNDSLGFLGYSGGSSWYLTDNYWNTSFSILHTGNYSSYALPLSGGTINGQLIVKTSLDYPFTIFRNSSAASYVAFENKDGYLGDLGFLKDGTFYVNTNGVNERILHSGNYSSYALPLSGGTLTGRIITWSDLIHVYASSGSANAYISYYSNDGSTYYGDMGFYNDGSPAIWTSSTKWKKLIHEGNISSYNAGSATKLQTARTIWGQSFDGTGNVSGSLSSVGKITYANASERTMLSITNGNYPFSMVYKGNQTKLYNVDFIGTWGSQNSISFGCGGGGNTVDAQTAWMTIVKGNVGIGTPSPGYNLHVNGSLGSTSVQVGSIFLGEQNEINGTSTRLWLNYSGSAQLLLGNNGYPVIVGTYANQAANIQSTLNYAALNVFGTIFGYRYGKKASGAAFMFDKPGSNYTGIGADGSTDTIYFGACNKDADWVSYSQIWKFGGSILATGGTSMYSDQRKKTILNHVELSLKQIANAPLIKHYYNSDQNKTTHVGSIAQYWAELNDWFCKLDDEGYYTMEIQNCALASAISIARHLEKYESKTDKTIRKMKMRIKELEDKLERLEGGKYGCN